MLMIFGTCIAFHRYYMHRVSQEKALFKQFGLISKNNCLEMKDYYKKLIKIIEKNQSEEKKHKDKDKGKENSHHRVK